ncbi:disease resistance protein At4g27190-like [Populus alba]|uniref:disease resistance protein At4g27190-like n=1 Tax=Populus alba TaxID=43335 RepID=UPI003CC6F7F1
MEIDIKEIPSNLSPRYPKLGTLLLCGNYKLELITDFFLKKLCGLKVLDLCFTAIHELPGSVAGLACLTASLLMGFYKMRHVPSLAKLMTLEMLDFCCATLEEMPHGLELLCNLRYLNLDRTRLKEFPATMLSNLSNLQFLCLHQSLGGFRSVEVEEVAGLRMLESSKCHFYDVIDFN